MTTLTEYAEAAEWFRSEAERDRKFAERFLGDSRIRMDRSVDFYNLAATVLRSLAEGKVLVPREPTYAMVQAGIKAALANGYGEHIYAAMIAAATQGETE